MGRSFLFKFPLGLVNMVGWLCSSLLHLLPNVAALHFFFHRYCDGLNDIGPKAHMFEILSSSWWNCLERIGRYGLLKEVHYSAFEVSKVHIIPS